MACVQCFFGKFARKIDCPMHLLPFLYEILANILLATPIFLLVQWLLKKTKLGDQARSILSLIGTLIALPVIKFLLVFGLLGVLDFHPNEKFSREIWMENLDKRHSMTKDLVEGNVLAGKNKAEVLDLLGNPLESDSSDVWHYDMGWSGAGFGWEMHSLAVTFSNGTVEAVNATTIQE